jgi:hypothetical protein
MENTELTFGSKACGVSFNPGGHALVNKIKADFANIVDQLHGLREGTQNAEMKRMYSIAITEAQTAQMWAVKAVTWSFD